MPHSLGSRCPLYGESAAPCPCSCLCQCLSFLPLLLPLPLPLLLVLPRTFTTPTAPATASSPTPDSATRHCPCRSLIPPPPPLPLRQSSPTLMTRIPSRVMFNPPSLSLFYFISPHKWHCHGRILSLRKPIYIYFICSIPGIVQPPPPPLGSGKGMKVAAGRERCRGLPQRTDTMRPEASTHGIEGALTSSFPYGLEVPRGGRTPG